MEANVLPQDRWADTPEGLGRRFVFKDFSEAFAFMTRVAMLAERAGHHPTWTNTWNTVDIRLNTHDAGNTITDKDHRLARAIDGLLG